MNRVLRLARRRTAAAPTRLMSRAAGRRLPAGPLTGSASCLRVTGAGLEEDCNAAMFVPGERIADALNFSVVARSAREARRARRRLACE
jgi:hypothetical protein